MRGFFNLFCKKKAYILNILVDTLEDGYFCSTILLPYFPFQSLKKKQTKKLSIISKQWNNCLFLIYNTFLPPASSPKIPTYHTTIIFFVLFIQPKIDKQQFKI